MVAIEAVNGGVHGIMWALVRPLRACNLLCERSSGMSFICTVKRAGCMVWIRWVKAGRMGSRVVAKAGRRPW